MRSVVLVLMWIVPWDPTCDSGSCCRLPLQPQGRQRGQPKAFSIKNIKTDPERDGATEGTGEAELVGVVVCALSTLATSLP